MKKHYKPNKVELTNFVKAKKEEKAEESYLSQEASSLDSESISILKKLLRFTDKEELFKILLKKPLKDKHSKKSVRLSIIPTDVEDNSTLEIKKKK